MSTQENLSLETLMQQKEELEKEIRRRINAERKKKIAEIQAIMRAFDITPDELGGGSRKRGNGRRYQHPETGAVWEGLGKRPKWITDAVANGIDIETFRV